MHELVRRSINLASSEGYLDNLHRVYDVSCVASRTISDRTIADLTNAYANRDSVEIVTKLLELDKFPFDDIYVGFLRTDPNAIARNPETVRRIANRVFSIPQEDLIKLCKQPKVDNRRMGELFHNWFFGLGFPKLSKETFLRTDSFTDLDNKVHKILTMEGTRKDFQKFANERLGCGLEKELDILVKVNGQYIIGEAKYFSGYGGHQNDQFADAENFLLSTQGEATRIAVLDGVVWLDNKNKMCRKVRRLESIAMSALLLPEFLRGLNVEVQPMDSSTT